MKKRLVFWLKIIVGLILLLSIFSFAAIRFIEHKLLSTLPPEYRTYYKEWKTKNIHIDMAKFKTDPFSPETLAALRKFNKIRVEKSVSAEALAEKFRNINLTTSTLQSSMTMMPPFEMDAPENSSSPMASLKNPYIKHEKPDIELSPAELEERLEKLLKDLPPLEPLFDAFVNVVSQPDYDIGAFGLSRGPDSPPWGFPVNSYSAIQICSRLLHLKTRDMIRKGDIEGTFNASAAIIRSSRILPYSDLITALVSFGILNTGTNACMEAIDACNDSVILRRELVQLIEMKPLYDAIDPNEELSIMNDVGHVRALMRLGIHAEIREKTGREIVAEFLRVTAEYMEKRDLPTITDDYYKKMTLNAIKENKKILVLFSSRINSIRSLWTKIQSPVLTPFYYTVSIPNSYEYHVREKNALNKYNLLLLNTASKLFTLERGRTFEKIEELVPDFLPEIPKDIYNSDDDILRSDPFASDSRPYGTSPTLYSIGPDGIDQKAAIQYDPTNGTVSPGDIFF